MPNDEQLYAPPAYVTDFDDSVDPGGLKRAWHDSVRTTIEDQAKSQKPDPTDRDNYPGERSLFDALGSSATPKPVPWFAFPQALRGWYPDDDDRRWKAADTLFPIKGAKKAVVEDVQDGDEQTVVIKEVGEDIELFYRQQDEYCEWFTHIDPQTKNITRIDFTAENPDYWEVLVDNDLKLAVKLYQRYVSADVAPEDLVWQHDVVIDDGNGNLSVYAREGTYNRLNKWTTTHGVMHLTHPANNLFAEIVLAAQATVQRRSPDGAPFTATTLACCAGFGGVRRSSDPNIGFTVNQLVGQGNRVALADPVGLYIATLDRDAAGTWEVARGSEDNKMILRASFTPDQDAPLQWGGQIADNMQMNLYAIAEKAAGAKPKPEPCRGHCCAYPGRPGVQDYFPLRLACERLPWDLFKDDFVPYPRDEADQPGPAAAAAVAQQSTVLWDRPFTRTFSERYADL
jgi:hypothetical protein